MNIFLLAWNLPDGELARASSALPRLAKIYPNLDPDTAWSLGGSNHVFAASMHGNAQHVQPRVYIHQPDAGQVTLFDGCLVDTSGRFAAHDAKQLAAHWGDLPNALEGQFVAARVTINPRKMEVITDPLGAYQVYYTKHGTSYLVSNSVHLLSEITGNKEIDALGASMYLTLGWAGSDRTLRRDVYTMPGGQLWLWDETAREPKKSSYFDRTRLWHGRKGKLSTTAIGELADRLVRIFTLLTDHLGPVECPITGGRDSRAMAALLLRGRLPAQYYTGGALESSDVRIGKEIARRFGLSHVATGTPIGESTSLANPIIRDWDNVSRRLVLQCDGMVSLCLIRNTLYKPLVEGKLPVHLYGGGGEIARGYYVTPAFFFGGNALSHVENYMVGRLMAVPRRWVREETVSITRQYVKRFCEEVTAEGFPPIDVPDLFYAYERVRRWGGANIRSYRPMADVFSPFDTRPFIEAAFSIPALRRFSEHVHYELIRYLVPQLRRIPLEKHWPIQAPVINLYFVPVQSRLKKAWSKVMRGRGKKPIPSLGLRLEQYDWLEAKRNDLRARCLDQAGSPLWDFVDRRALEDVFSGRRRFAETGYPPKALFDTVTLFEYALT